MIPLIFASNARSFNTLGYGELSESTRCEVFESRNGEFTLEIDVPITARYFRLLNVGIFVVADANETLKRQAFEVYKVSKPLNGIVTAYANHVSYRLKYSVIKPLNVTGAAAVFNALNSQSSAYYVEGNRFTFETDITSSAGIVTKDYYSVREVLGGIDGSILDTFGGCFLWDNFKVKLCQNRGTDNGVRIVYGKNLKDISVDYDNEEKFTAIYPYYKKSDGTFVVGTQIWRSVYDANYTYHRTIAKSYNEKYGSTIPTPAQLNAAAQADVNNAGLPDVSLDVDVIPLHTTIEYKSFAPLERMQIDDTVRVYVPTLDVNVSAKVISTRYNVLLNRLESVEIGNYRTTLADAIRALNNA